MGWKLVLAGLWLLSSSGPASGQEVRGVERIVILDAESRTVGDVASLAGPAGATAALDVDGQLLLLQVTRERFIGNADTSILYESPDCSGPAYVEPGPISFGPSLTAVVVAPPGATAYVGDPGGPLVQIMWRSWRNRNSEECNPQAPAANVEALPVTPLINLSEFFTPPFSLVAATVVPPATATPSPSPPPSSTPSSVPTSTEPPSATQTPPAVTATPTMISAPAACCGDCNADGEVRVEELISGVNRLLNGCPAP